MRKILIYGCYGFHPLFRMSGVVAYVLSLRSSQRNRLRRALNLKCGGEREASFGSKMAFPRVEKGAKRVEIEESCIKTKMVRTRTNSKLVGTSTKIAGTKMAKGTPSTTILTKVRTDVVVV